MVETAAEMEAYVLEDILEVGFAFLHIAELTQEPVNSPLERKLCSKASHWVLVTCVMCQDRLAVQLDQSRIECSHSLFINWGYGVWSRRSEWGEKGKLRISFHSCLLVTFRLTH